MPAGDKTGPMGMGPMTGRGAGACAGAAVPSSGFWGFGRRRGGRGRGGFGYRAITPVEVATQTTPDTTAELKQMLENISARLAVLEGTTKEE